MTQLRALTAKIDVTEKGYILTICDTDSNREREVTQTFDERDELKANLAAAIDGALAAAPARFDRYRECVERDFKASKDLREIERRTRELANAAALAKIAELEAVTKAKAKVTKAAISGIEKTANEVHDEVNKASAEAIGKPVQEVAMTNGRLRRRR